MFKQVRLVLLTGSLVFGFSALLLVLAPGTFNELLGLQPSNQLDWSMRMIGITLFALAGNMFSVSKFGSNESVQFSGRVMMVSAFALGVLTLLVPVTLNWFTVTYSLIGFGFSAAYLWASIKK